METVSIRNPGMSWDIAANIHFPPGFDAARRYPAIVSNHPIDYYRNPQANSSTRMLFSHAATNLAWDAFAEPLLTQTAKPVSGQNALQSSVLEFA